MTDLDAVLERFAEILATKLVAKLNGGAPPASDPPDRLLSVREAAERLGVSTRYLYSRADSYPFTKRLSAKVLRFSAIGLERWLARTK